MKQKHFSSEGEVSMEFLLLSPRSKYGLCATVYIAPSGDDDLRDHRLVSASFKIGQISLRFGEGLRGARSPEQGLTNA
jgi:hypothetical protein